MDQKNSNKGVITVKYLNPYDLSNPLIWKHDVYGTLGASFNSQQYVNYAKAVGYKYNNIIGNASVFKKQPQTVKIQISKTPIPDLNSYTKIIYKDVSSKKVVHMLTIKGQTGDRIPFNKLTDHQALQKLPNGHYQFVKIGQHDKTIKNDGHNIIWVKKLQSKPQKRSQITLYYMDTNNKLIGNPRMVSGPVGSNFSLDPYKLPLGTKNKFQFAGLIDGKSSYKFTDNPQGIIVRVKPNPKLNKKSKSKAAHHDRIGTIRVYFMINGHVITVGNVQKRSGSAFYLTDQLAKRIGMPDKYHVSNVYPQIKRFSAGVQKIIVNVAKNQTRSHHNSEHGQRKDNKVRQATKESTNEPAKNSNHRQNLNKTKSIRSAKSKRDANSKLSTTQTPKDLGQILIKLASSLMTLGKILKDRR